jgi:hypothetical protein
MAVSFVPRFHHTAWVDNVDRVQAAGTNGFNVRFQDVEAEFAKLSTVISEIDTAIAALQAAPTAAPVTLTLTPQLATIGRPWGHTIGAATKFAGELGASGLQSLTLPDRVRIRSLRVLGQKENGNLTVNLRRQALPPSANPELVVSAACPNGPIDVTFEPANPAVATVNNGQFRYYLTAELDSATSAATVLLSAFQITYVAG